MLIDVRPADEFATWHLMGSHNVPVATCDSVDLEGVRYHRFSILLQLGDEN